jgi:ATP-binding cassette subfamily F protein uup
LGLDGEGNAGVFADYSQWEAWLEERKAAAQKDIRATGREKAGDQAARQPSGKKKLSYLEAREYDGIEMHVAKAEEILQSKREQLENPQIASDGPRLLAAHAELEEAQDRVDTLYARWAELEKKKG